MIRLLTTMFCGCLLATMAHGDRPARPNPADQRAALTRNQKLIQLLVDHGLRVSTEVDSLKRAKECNRMAKEVLREIRRAVEDDDRSRVAELTRPLQVIVGQGVGQIFRQVRPHIKAGSLAERDLFEVRDETRLLSVPIESLLDIYKGSAVERELRRTLEALHSGQREVELASRAKP